MKKKTKNKIRELIEGIIVTEKRVDVDGQLYTDKEIENIAITLSESQGSELANAYKIIFERTLYTLIMRLSLMKSDMSVDERAYWSAHYSGQITMVRSLMAKPEEFALELEDITKERESE